ncbi:hypothetical protein GGX14DRAFT_387913 [Mycena pura]|uniref:F-box domain-containing protein n=1 Tax=Mycena pura TaxID=153505 RepID=A0AAD6YMI3_9AGAR|nr:hypothetical protein GGX14DRAFT_387913 [Mycena pura]
MSAPDKQKELETQLKAVVYPILSLPVELTARIFVECLPANFRRAPLLLMRVSDDASVTEKLDISVVLPRLWRLEINFPYNILGRLISSNSSLHQLQCLDVTSLDSELKAVLNNTPLLKELSWSRISIGDLDSRWFASTTVTKLEFSWAGSAAQFLSILENFPSLSDLTFYTDGKAFIARPQPSISHS